ncbi:hypothetical protein ANG5_1629 [Streptococcus constellatus subsp. pharyngis SK1060 = CCUG 46377]|uniref:Uncharacterized protein n=1 Tax=Streptococcus constellatus subsp. pharyngis SK1060 = CCUG 46377 TaxID=1035184 RepID=U2XYC3_STRCV|nr:hypothetical protein ANG5_1629 [Streptococcus constellatus subsp. pharyngis SK1060 = CCUG 46377]
MGGISHREIHEKNHARLCQSVHGFIRDSYIAVSLTFLLVGPIANTASSLIGSGLTAIQGFRLILYGVLLGAQLRLLSLLPI